MIPMRKNKGKSIGACLHNHTSYIQNPDKTEQGELVSSYQCSPLTVDEEFLLTKRLYEQTTGRSQKSDVIAYQVRQSFKPGEVTPEEANRIGYEFAERFLKGKHAFIVATHTDRAHIHNHIIYNSTALDGTRKFKNFWLSSFAVQRLSDLICLEHQLSTIEYKPYRERQKRIVYPPKESNRDRLCSVICNDYGFPINPDSYAALVRRVGKKAGIEKIHPHMFRHTFVSILLSNPNIGVATVAAEAGHAQPSTTLAIYTQVYDRRRDEIRKQMSKELYK